jgi:hypothetical protein
MLHVKKLPAKLTQVISLNSKITMSKKKATTLLVLNNPAQSLNVTAENSDQLSIAVAVMCSSNHNQSIT